MSQYERHLDEFGVALGAAATRRARGPRRRIVTAIAVATTVAVVVVLGLGSSPSGPGDVVGRALAAVAAPEGIVHFRVVQTGGPAEVNEHDVRITNPVCRASAPVEVWQAQAPLEWRAVFPAPDSTEGCGRTIDMHGRLIEGPQIRGYADGTTTDYSPQNGTANVISGYALGSGAERLPVYHGERESLAEHPQGPIAAVREMLRDGRLTDAGERTIDGRAVRTLVGERGSAEEGPRPVVYDVDAESFEPVRFSYAFRLPTVRRGADGKLSSTPDGGWHGGRLDFTSYEVLPDDAEHRTLLRVELAPDTDVRRQTQDELRRRIASESRGVAVDD